MSSFTRTNANSSRAGTNSNRPPRGLGAGGKQLNINRPVRDSNERVPTRAEALNRIEEQYEVERAIHEEKKREKEAKKREEYLARYKHVDQGHRLNDGLLDEAAGYAVDYKPKESLEEVRKRQQKHFNNIALVFQEEQKKIGEQQKLLDAEKALKKLEEYSQHINVGYRLGRGDGNRPAPNYLTAETSKNEHAKPKEREGTNSSSSKQQQKKHLTENKLPESVIQREPKDQKHNMTQEHLDQNSHCLEKSVKKSENNNIPVHQETGFEVDKDNNLAVGYNPNETFEEVLKRQHEQLKNFALTRKGRESYNLEEKGVENLENNIDCEIGFELDPDDNSDEQRCVRQVLEVLDDDEDLPNNERPDLQAPISPELMLEGETEEEFLQRQEEQLIIEAMLLSQIEFETKQTEKLQKNSAPSTPGQGIKKEEKRECTGCIKVREAKVLQTIVSEEKTKIQNFEPATRQADTTKGAIPKNKAATFPDVTEKNENDTKIHNENEKSVNDGAVQKRHSVREAHSQLNMSKLLDQIEESASTNNVSQANIVPKQPGESSKPSGVEPASCVLRNKNGAVLVLRPTPQQLNQALAQKLEVQEEMDKRGSSIHYKPTPEQVPLYYNNRFDINQRCDVANQTSAVPKKDSRLADMPATVKSAGAPSNGENIKEDTPYDHQAELRAARLRFQKKYEETLKKLQGEKNNQ
ncbi:uncharacterized protein LOC129005384 [Macrosteles quadrilineatus]|uniref:uncharacterized protein LOC129005384 n=1 Tax=Macrosteles quadrilineatus TaxID=74068 RepID=UPI0023E2B1D0|nr:uncharacterized protein LOC129005384 [Macrosteles quadrilineatus]